MPRSPGVPAVIRTEQAEVGFTTDRTPSCTPRACTATRAPKGGSMPRRARTGVARSRNHRKAVMLDAHHEVERTRFSPESVTRALSTLL